MSEHLRIAIAKGRVLKETLPLLAKAGVELLDDLDISRKLIFATSDPAVDLVIVRASDVSTYVRYGACDLGITGKDLLLETGGDDLYELADLKISPCRLIVAGKLQSTLPADDDRRCYRVATKYPNITRAYFAEKGIQTEVIKLYGSMELAPLAGLADWIVDLTASGDTLRANGLEELEFITDISARLVANRAATKLKREQVEDMVGRIRANVK